MTASGPISITDGHPGRFALSLPQLTGARSRAWNLMSRAHLPETPSGVTVHVNAGATLAATATFVDEIVRSVLLDRNAAGLVVTLAGPALTAQLQEAGQEHSVLDRLRVTAGPE